MNTQPITILNSLKLNSKDDLLNFSNNIESILAELELKILNVYDCQENKLLNEYQDPSLNAAKCDFFNKKAASPFSKYFNGGFQEEYKEGYTFGSVNCEHNGKIRIFDRNNYLEIQETPDKYHLFLCLDGKKFVYITEKA